MKIFKFCSLILVSIFVLQSCANFKPGDAKKSPPDPRERVKRNLEEGKGFRLNTLNTKNLGRGGNFEFATSNVLWRATLDIIDFMPLTSANYSGGIIITDWYLNEKNQNESIKITIRFLTNEIRSDALKIKVFTRRCETSLINCKYLESNDVLVNELKKEILKKASTYKKDKSKETRSNALPKKKTK